MSSQRLSAAPAPAPVESLAVQPDPRTAQAIAVYAAELERFAAGAIDAAAFKPFRAAHGVYEQRQDGTYMVRTRVTGGLLGAAQAQAIATIAAELGSNRVHLTTRQDVQIHDVSQEGTVTAMRRLLAAGLSCVGTGGHTVRNVVTCPLAGVCPREHFDVRPTVAALNAVLPTLAAEFKLPRKFKVSISGCACDCALAVFTDLGFVAAPRAGRAGFVVYAGGGMGQHARVADLLDEWATPADLATATRALLCLFDRHGDRENRARARLRFVFERLGGAALREEYAAAKAAHPIPLPILPPLLLQPATSAPAARPPWRDARAAAGLQAIAQRQPDAVTVALHPPLGLLTPAELAALATAAATFSAEHALCLTPAQGLLLRQVPRDRLADLARDLAAAVPALLQPGTLDGMTVCTSADTCRLGACLARDTARTLAATLDAALTPEQRRGLDIRISGCANSCAQSPVADLGLVGLIRRSDGVSRPHYRILLGARRGTDRPCFGNETAVVDAASLPQAVLQLLEQSPPAGN
jgi:sulfite reductase (ferredoxin)